MSSYNRINGVFASENAWLLTDVLRDEWKFDGVVVSDWGAVHEPTEALAALNRTARRLFLLAQRTAPDGDVVPVDLDIHHQLTRRAAAESAVLLTNNGVLPLRLGPGLRVAVIGELARTPRYQGAGSSAVNPTRIVTGLDALTARAAEHGAQVTFAAGYSVPPRDGAPPDDALVAEAARVATAADVVVLFLGLPGPSEAEGRDRTSIDLPANQIALAAAVAAAGATTVVALSNGSPVTTAAWRDGVDAVVEFWLTGSPRPFRSGWPTRPVSSTFQGRTAPSATARASTSGTATTTRATSLQDPVALTVTVEVTDTGSRAGAEVVQVYLGDHGASMQVPVRELRAFTKVLIAPGQRQRVALRVLREDLRHFDTVSGAWVHEGGPALVEVGSSSRDLRCSAQVELPGRPSPAPLTIWSTYREWCADRSGGAALKRIIESRGGIRGRMADLLSDETGRDSVLGVPLQSLVEFPGFPVEQADIGHILVDLEAETLR